jgi:hypothetical protein
MRRLRLLSSFAVLAAALGTATATAQSADPPPAPVAVFERADDGGAAKERLLPGLDDRRPSKTSLRLKGLKSGDLTVGKKVTVAGTLRPYVKGQKVTVLLKRGKKTIERRKLHVRPKGKSGKVGKFSLSDKLIKPGRYGAEAFHDKNAVLGGSKDQTRRFHIRYPDLSPGESGDAVKVFNKLLAELGYVNDENHSYDSATGRAVLAFRKVNGMARKESSSPGIFKKLAKGKGGFNLKHPGAGKHVEADLSRQVMVLASGGEVEEIYHISSGAPATPTILGKYHFYRKDAGYNSLGMYYSAYFIRGYATHGYHDVPAYPASHGCLRNPIPDSVHIYNWIDIGDPIYVYN